MLGSQYVNVAIKPPCMTGARATLQSIYDFHGTQLMRGKRSSRSMDGSLAPAADRYIFVLRKFPPYASPSGSLVRHLVSSLTPSKAVTVITWGDAPDKRHGLESVLWLAESAPPVTPIQRVLRRFLRWSQRSARRKQLRQALSDLRVGSEDVVVGCTPEEVRALAQIDVGGASLQTLMLERVARPDPRLESLRLFGALTKLWARRIESSALRKSKRILALPVPYAHVLEMHPHLAERVVAIEHPMLRDRTHIGPVANQPPRLVYAGGLDRYNRNPAGVLAALHTARLHAEFSADFYTYGNCEQQLRDARFTSWLNIQGRVSPDEADDALAYADVIVTIGNRNSDLMPSKLFDCMSTGRPILHFSQNNDDPYLPYLQKYPLSLTVSLRCGAVHNGNKIAHQLQQWAGCRLDWSTVRSAFPTALPTHVAALL